jgi:hypothetical protein
MVRRKTAHLALALSGGEASHRANGWARRGWCPPTAPVVGLACHLLSSALLYWAKAVLSPVALALLLTFLLPPRVTTLWHWGLHRAGSPVLVVVLAARLLGQTVP